MADLVIVVNFLDENFAEKIRLLILQVVNSLPVTRQFILICLRARSFLAGAQPRLDCLRFLNLVSWRDHLGGAYTVIILILLVVLAIERRFC